MLPQALARVVVPILLLASAPAHSTEPDAAAGSVRTEQIVAAALFGATQTDNVTARLGALHRSAGGCDRFGIGANIRWERAPSAEGAAPAAGGPNLADAFKGLRCRHGELAFWTGGYLDFAFLRPSGELDRSGFRTSGLTLGADMKMIEGASVGAAIGYGRRASAVDAVGSETRAHGQNATLYGAFEPIKAVGIDALVGVGDLSFDVRRGQAVDREMLSGDRDGSQVFGSLALRADLAASRLRITPYARYGYVRSQVDAYDERSGATTVAAFGRIAADEDTLALGIYAGCKLALGPATVEPGLRVEQRRVRTGASDQTLAYSDPASTGQSADSDVSLAASLVVPVRFGRTASVAFEYNYASSSALRDENVRAVLRAPF